MDIGVLETACCTKCCDGSSLYRRVRRVVDRADIDASVEPIDDTKEIARLSAMSTPALVVNGTVTVSGRTLNGRTC